ncbi:MAG: cell division protein FtsA [Clostridiales bacterium]|nr:cell division protein FtsA [Clostridiales bacterium]
MRQISTVIEIGTGKVVCVICETGKYDETHILGNATVTYPGYKNRKWVDRHSIAPAIKEALHEAEKMAGRKVKNVHIGIPGDFLKVVCIKSEIEFNTQKTLTQADINYLYQQSRSKLQVPKEYTVIHRCPILFILDDARKTMDPNTKRAKKVSVVVSYVLAEKWFGRGIKQMLLRYGYNASTFIGASYAEAMKFIPQEKRDHGAVMIDIGNTSTTVMVARGDGLMFHKVLNFGGANITEDIMKVLNTKHKVAEELKKRAIYGLSLSEQDNYEVCDKDTYKFEKFSAIKVQAIIEARLKEMIDVIVDTLDRSGCRLPKYVPVFVTGGTASMRGLREFIQKETNHNTIIVTPQSTCFNQPAYSSALAVADFALEAETEEEQGFFENIKNLFLR